MAISKTLAWVLAGGAVVALGGVAVWWWRRRRSKAAKLEQPPEPDRKPPPDVKLETVTSTIVGGVEPLRQGIDHKVVDSRLLEGGGERKPGGPGADDQDIRKDRQHDLYSKGQQALIYDSGLNLSTRVGK
jgi:hypothetical protein